MRVLFAIAHLDKGGGQAVQTSRLLQRLAPMVDGELLCLQTNGSKDTVPPVPRTTVVGELTFPSGVGRLRRAIAERLGHVDLVQVLDHYYALPAARFARARPLVVRLGTHPVDDLGSRYGLPGRTAMRLVNPWLYQDAKVVVNAQHLLSAFPPGKARCIPNGIDVDRYPASPDRSGARAELKLPEDAILVTFTGKIIPRKSVDDLYWLARAVPQIHVVLVGTDNEPYYGNRYHVELRKEFDDTLGRVHAVGEVPADRVSRYLEASDIFAFPSRMEGMPNSVLEAMAAGLPIVAYDAPAHREILDASDAILYKSREVLATAVQRLVQDPGLRARMGASARRQARDRFSLDAAARAYFDLYTWILASSSRSGG